MLTNAPSLKWGLGHSQMFPVGVIASSLHEHPTVSGSYQKMTLGDNCEPARLK